MGVIRRKVTETVVKKALSYIEKDPINNINKVIGLANKIAILHKHKEAIKEANSMMKDKDGMPYKLVERVINEVSRNCLKNFTINFFVNATLEGEPISLKNKERYNCEIPWIILIESTADCNLQHKDYMNKNNYISNKLSYDIMNKLIEEGKDLGVYIYIYAGGEPLIRKNELMELARNHKDCIFIVVTNGLLIDDIYAQNISDLGNIVFVLTVDGFELETDRKRGLGSYRKLIKAMDILRSNKVAFGFISPYDENNLETIISEKYINFMIGKGCLFGALVNNEIFKGEGQSKSLTDSKLDNLENIVDKYKETKPILLTNVRDRDYSKKEYLNEDKSYICVDSSGFVKSSLFDKETKVNINNCDLIKCLQSIKR